MWCLVLAEGIRLNSFLSLKVFGRLLFHFLTDLGAWDKPVIVVVGWEGGGQKRNATSKRWEKRKISRGDDRCAAKSRLDAQV